MTNPNNLPLRATLPLLFLILAGLPSPLSAATTETAEVEPGSKVRVTYEQLDAGGEYHLDIQEKDSSKYTIKESDFKTGFKGNTLWQRMDKKHYVVTVPAASVPPSVGVKGTFDEGGGGGGVEPSTPRDFEVDLDSVPAKLTEVQFGGDKYIELKSDNASTTYSRPQWLDKDDDQSPSDFENGERNYPVAYIRNSKPKIGVKIKLIGVPAGASVKVKAQGTNGIDIPETTATISGSYATLPLVESSGTWPNTVKFYDQAFSLNWKISVNGGGAWQDLATSTHSVAVTLATPATALTQESLFRIACKEPSGKSTIADVTSAIWSEFSDRLVKRTDDETLIYYKTPTPTSVTAADLLESRDGNCNAWADLFRHSLLVHGIDTAVPRTVVPPERIVYNNTDRQLAIHVFSGFLVKKWTLDGQLTWWDFDANHNCINDAFEDDKDPSIDYAGAMHAASLPASFSDMKDEVGIPGQSKDDPPSNFAYHVLIRIGAALYDPSYGKGPFTSLASWQSEMVYGFVAGVISNGEPSFTVLPLANDPTGLSVVESAYEQP